MKKLFLFALVGFAVQAMGADYFTWDGHSLAPLPNPQNITCDHWAIWVFGDDVSPVAGKQWGQVDGKTPEEAEKNWDADMKFEVKWKRFAHIQSDPFGYENRIGPIAILNPPVALPSPDFGPLGQKLGAAYDQAKKLYDTCQQLMDAYDEDVRNGTTQWGYYTDPKNEIVEYFKQVKETVEQINKLRERLETVNGEALLEIDGQLNAMKQSLSLTESHAQALAPIVHAQIASNNGSNQPSPNNANVGNDTSSWMGKLVADSQYPGNSNVLVVDGSNLVYKHYNPQEGWNRTYTLPLKNITSVVTESEFMGQNGPSMGLYINATNYNKKWSMTIPGQSGDYLFTYLDIWFGDTNDTENCRQYLISHRVQ